MVVCKKVVLTNPGGGRFLVGWPLRLCAYACRQHFLRRAAALAGRQNTYTYTYSGTKKKKSVRMRVTKLLDPRATARWLKLVIACVITYIP